MKNKSVFGLTIKGMFFLSKEVKKNGCYLLHNVADMK
jgi:hypothetical protein